MERIPQHKTTNYGTVRGKRRQHACYKMSHRQMVFKQELSNSENKANNQQTGLHEIKYLVYNKEKPMQSKKNLC